MERCLWRARGGSRSPKARGSTESKRSLDRQRRQIILLLLLLALHRLLLLLDLTLELFDLRFLRIEFLQVALVGGRGVRQLVDVGPQPALVFRDRLQLAA